MLKRHLSAQAELCRNRQHIPLGVIELPLVGVSHLQPAWGRMEHSLVFWKSTEVKCVVVKEGDQVFISVIRCYLGFYF